MKGLLARIMVQLQKNERAADKALIAYQEVTLDVDKHTLSTNGKEQKLTRTEYAILKLLMQNLGQVVAKLTILDRISLDMPDCTEDSLKSHIYNLRKKLKALTGKEYISSVWGIGFILAEKICLPIQFPLLA
ncbi:MAG: winged helix-turn-helix transcriptional regulator [Ruminococcus sp.]|nr:winged helix-turn-helix transcriptional regulator [Ruminococcus sp.]